MKHICSWGSKVQVWRGVQIPRNLPTIYQRASPQEAQSQVTLCKSQAEKKLVRDPQALRISTGPIWRLILIPVSEPDLKIGVLEQKQPRCHGSQSSQESSMFSPPFNDNRFTKRNEG